MMNGRGDQSNSLSRGWRGSRLRHYLNKFRYFGLRYQCPICGSHLRRFRPAGRRLPVLDEKQVIGGGYRPNGRCPVCFANDRARLIFLYLEKKTGILFEKTKLLHVAPESGLSRILSRCKNINYLTADISPDKAMVRMDITEIAYPDNWFDAIICNHVLEHIADDRKAIRELHRVLRPGGWGILQVPISLSLRTTHEDFSITAPADRERVFGQADHVRLYASDYPARLRECGFETSVFDWQEDETFSTVGNRYGLLPEERIFLVRKSAEAPQG